jgi:solute:Na+ symporter, SSS family
MGEDIITVFQSANWILGILAVFVLVILYLGVRYSSKIEEGDDLVLAGRGLTMPFLIPSILSTWICAGAIMGAAGEAYLGGFQGVLWDPFGPVLMFILVGLFFATRLRKGGFTTVVDFMNSRFGDRMGAMYMIIQILSAVGWLGGQLVALGTIIYLTTGFSMTVAIAVGALVMIVVTYMGGLWALSRIDAIVFVLIILGLVVMFPIVIEEVGGFAYLFENAEVYYEVPPFTIFPASEEDGGFLGYVGILAIAFWISAWTALGLGDLSSQVLLQRVLAAKNEMTAKYSFLLSGLLYLVIGIIPVTIGIAMYTYGLRLPEDQHELVLPWVADFMLPPWASTLFVVALAGAIVGTVGDTCLITATMFGHNVYKYFKPNASNKDTLRMVRIAIPIVMISALVLALYFETIYKLIVFSGALQLTTVTAAYIAGFYWKKANSTGAIWSFIAGFVSWLIFYVIVFYGDMTEGYVWDAVYISMVPGAIVSLITLIVVSLLTQKSSPPKAFVDAKGNVM